MLPPAVLLMGPPPFLTSRLVGAPLPFVTLLVDVLPPIALPLPLRLLFRTLFSGAFVPTLALLLMRLYGHLCLRLWAPLRPS